MSQSEISPTQVREMLLLTADRVIAAEPELSAADRALGDGDHGLGMQRGMKAVQAKLAELPDETSIEQLFTGAGMAMLSSMGGASGALFGTLFRAGGKAVGDRESLDGSGLADFFQAALEGVQTRGKAKPGDKTMIDALAPAAGAATEQAGAGVAAVAAAAAKAAAEGRDASKDMVATMGRAKTLGQGSVGHPDAGACSVAIICQAFADFIDQA